MHACILLEIITCEGTKPNLWAGFVLATLNSKGERMHVRCVVNASELGW